MGRLIDSEYLKEDMKRYGWEHVDSTVTEYVDGLDTAEAIPKADYEARLRADMVAMLDDILLGIDEQKSYGFSYRGGFGGGMDCASAVVQQKINDLKGEHGENTN